MKVACCYNCDIRNNGTATYAMRSLKQIEGVEAFHIRPGADPLPSADVYIYVDDGRDDIQWIPPSPNAYWAVDTHLGYGYRLWKAKQFDRVFTAQKDGAARLRHDGVEWAEWLPLACQPEAHPNRQEMISKGGNPKDLDPIFDLVFVGFLNDPELDGYNNRVDYLDKLFKAFPNSWLSTGAFFEDMAARILRGRLGFNISIRNDLNMRVFEIMSIGVPLLTNSNVEGIDDLFESGLHYIPYQGMEEMVEMAGIALCQNGELSKIADAGHLKVRSEHTYRHRMVAILEEMKNV